MMTEQTLKKTLSIDLASRVGVRVLWNCVRSGFLLLPIVVYLALDPSANIALLVGGFFGLILGIALPMALLNAGIVALVVPRISTNISITMQPEALRAPVFATNYLGLPIVYLLMTFVLNLVYPTGILWWFMMAVGAWLFSGFIAISAIDHALRWLAIYGLPRKEK